MYGHFVQISWLRFVISFISLACFWIVFWHFTEDQNIKGKFKDLCGLNSFPFPLFSQKCWLLL